MWMHASISILSGLNGISLNRTIFIVMERAYIERGKRVTDGLVGRKVRVVGFENSVPKGLKLIIGDTAHMSI